MDGIFSSKTAIFNLLVKPLHKGFCVIFRLSSLHHALELALGEGASEQLVGNLVHILEFDHEDLVGAEVDEAEIVEGGESLTEDLVLLGSHLLEVELLG